MTESSDNARTKTRLWRPIGLDGGTLFRANGIRQKFARHTHEDYAVGVITQGALGFDYRGERMIAGQGEINLVVPGEAHTGHPALGSDWSYRMLYVEPARMREIAQQCGLHAGALPFF